MDAHVDDGNDPIEIALAIAKLIQKKQLKPHYAVGPFMQKFSLTFKANSYRRKPLNDS